MSKQLTFEMTVAPMFTIILWIIFCPELPAFYDAQAHLTGHWPRGYKTFSMLNSAEHDIYPAHMC